MTGLEMATAERSDLADFLATLTPEQWQEPSLCEDWRVRDVVAHLMSFDGVRVLGMVRRAIRGRLIHQPGGRGRARLAVGAGSQRVQPGAAGWRLSRGVRLVPTDLDWSHGSGPEVTGPAEAVLMAIAGRVSAVGELAGPGQPVVALRLGR